jgi:uncharacterized protein (DUF58 family)
MTGRFLLLVLCIFGLLLWGMMTLQGGIILLTIPLLVYLAVGILFAPGDVSIEAARHLNVRLVDQDAPVKVKLEIQNKGNAADELYLVEDISTGFELIQGETGLYKPLMKDEEFDLDYTLICPRGKHVFRGVLAEFSDHFGLIQRRIYLPISSDFQTVPRVARLRQVRILPRQTRGFTGPIPSRQTGAGMIFWGVREFHLGDSLRRINWKVSSRNPGRLFTNEFEMERIADIGIILDARQRMNVVVNDESLFEYSVQAAAALAEAFLEDGHRVSLLTYGYGMQRIYPGYGKLQRERILRALSEATPGSNLALENFSYLPTRLFPAKSQMVLVSPLNYKDFSAFANLCSKGYEVLLVSPDPVDFEFQLFGEYQTEDAALGYAHRLAVAERSLLLRKLSRLGVRVIDWQVHQPLDQVVRLKLNRQAIIRRNLPRSAE